MARPYLSLEHPIRLAHRGSRHLWPENTMAAFCGAVDLGYRYLETDVRTTRDHVVVVFHDATLERLTNGVGKVAEWTWEDLRYLDAGWSFEQEGEHPHRGRGLTIPRLDELFATWPDVHFNLDLKAPGIEWDVAECIVRAGRMDSVLIGSFHDRRIARFRRITRGAVATSAGTTTALRMFAASRLGRTHRAPVDAYQLPYDTAGMRLDPRLVEAVHRTGAHLHAWTVNDAAAMGTLLDLGVDGIITDRPDVLNEVLRGRGHDV